MDTSVKITPVQDTRRPTKKTSTPVDETKTKKHVYNLHYISRRWVAIQHPVINWSAAANSIELSQGKAKFGKHGLHTLKSSKKLVHVNKCPRSPCLNQKRWMIIPTTITSKHSNISLQLTCINMLKPGLGVIKLEYSLRLKIKRNDWLLVNMCQ